MFKLKPDDQSRFWAKIDQRSADDCWPWVAKSRNAQGYGLFTLSTGKSGGLKVVASRVACLLSHGPPPEDGLHALHSCDNPECCNPKHLRWGTQQDNVDDAIKRKRHVLPPDTHTNSAWNVKRLSAMPKGERLWNQTLSEQQVREIWRLHLENRNVTEIANSVGAAKHAVADVCRGRTWQHLSDAPSPELLKAGGVRRGYNQFSQ